jgi:hypothetical protein
MPRSTILGSRFAPASRRGMVTRPVTEKCFQHRRGRKRHEYISGSQHVEQHQIGTGMSLQQALNFLCMYQTSSPSHRHIQFPCISVDTPRTPDHAFNPQRALAVPQFKPPESSKPEVEFIVDRSGMSHRVAPLKFTERVPQVAPLGVNFNICSFIELLFPMGLIPAPLQSIVRRSPATDMAADFGGTEILLSNQPFARRFEGLKLPVLQPLYGKKKIWGGRSGRMTSCELAG